jgi:hypothetical protein
LDLAGQSLVAALGLAAVHLVAVRLATLHAAPRSRWLSMASGASVAYVFVYLLPELAEHQTGFSQLSALAFLQHHVWLVALAGFSIFYGLEQLARSSRGGAHDTAAPPPEVFWLHVASFALYNALIGYLLVRGERTPKGLWLFACAIGLHVLVIDSGLRRHFRARYDRAGRWLLAAAPLAGLALGFALELRGTTVGVLTAFLGGSMVLHAMNQELPEERASRWWAFALGAGGYAALLLALGRA